MRKNKKKKTNKNYINKITIGNPIKIPILFIDLF